MAQVDRTEGLVGNTGIKAPCAVATTANITLSAEQSIDGVTTSASRVLVKNQTDTTENGIYVSDSGDWERADDFDGSRDIMTGTQIFVSGGTLGSGFWYVSTASDPTPGDAMAFSRWTPIRGLGAWVTATDYAVNDIVSNGGNSYICSEAHTSGTFATDLAAIKWTVLATKGTDGAGTGDMLAANNLSEVTPATARTNLGLAIGTDVLAYSATAAKTDTEQAWTAQQTPMNGTLTDGATINWNGDSNGQIVGVTLGGNRTLAAPTNINQYACYVLRVAQDGTGSRTLTWNAAYKFAGGTDPTLSTAASSVDIYTFIGGAANTLECVGQAKGVA